MFSYIGPRFPNGDLDIQHDSVCHFRKELDPDRIFDIYCSINKNGSEDEIYWTISGKAELFLTDSKNKTTRKFTHNLEPFSIACGWAKWIGSYEDIFEKAGITENLASEPHAISPKLLEPYSNEHLLAFTAYEGSIKVSSPNGRLKEVRQ